MRCGSGSCISQLLIRYRLAALIRQFIAQVILKLLQALLRQRGFEYLRGSDSYARRSINVVRGKHNRPPVLEAALTLRGKK
jgi:hypothetical protein